jgi:elongation factor Ts
MSELSEKIKQLRKMTSASIIDCRKALDKSGNDIPKAVEFLRKRGQDIAEEKSKREAREGIIESYIHSGGKVGVLLEINCETDFVAKNNEFKQLAHDLAMHIAAMNPQYIANTKMQKPCKDAKKKPEEVCLLSQPFIKNPEITVGEKINEKISRLGENIQVKRFIRYEIGGE